MDSRFLRRHLLVTVSDRRELWHAAKSPAWAVARLLSDPACAGFAVCLKPDAEILERIDVLEQGATAAAVIGSAQLGEGLSALLQEGLAQTLGEELDDDAPVIRMINAILNEAALRRASDIHLEPYADRSVVRFRIDGLLHDVAHPPRALHAALISRIKVMAQLDIAEKRLPQDGRMTVRAPGGALDLRISTLPTGSGERAVLRLLAKGQGPVSLAALGMAENTLLNFRGLVSQPYGIVLVTGPTGSGKTTTLYAVLAEIDTHTRNVMTVEDPIEYEIAGVAQTQVHAKIGLGFAQSLRSILRQDPDVILIGEIRDLETAQIAIQASLTGHLVFATLHTNDAAAAVSRLLDMGVEPFLLSSSLLGVLAQRLVRRLCTVCHGKGCNACAGSGYQGRTGIFELMTVSDPIRQAIKSCEDASQIRQRALSEGLIPMQEDGIRLVAQGVTTEAEIRRVVQHQAEAVS